MIHEHMAAFIEARKNLKETLKGLALTSINTFWEYIADEGMPPGVSEIIHEVDAELSKNSNVELDEDIMALQFEGMTEDGESEQV